MIATVKTERKQGKFIVRPDAAKLVWTHKLAVPETPENMRKDNYATLVVGNYEYNVLHFRDRDWAAVDVDVPE